MSRSIGNKTRHRIVAAGDLNTLFGHGEDGDPYFADRHAMVFERMKILGLSFVGPQYPNGRQAEPRPDELPADSRNVPTYRPGKNPATATRQLDFVFASRSMADSVRTRALNGVDEWGPSDRCRVEIEVG